MKNEFPGYFALSEKELVEVWRDCIFAFDANILLNFYRYSDSTREKFLRVLNQLGDRVWLPNQVAYEYLQNRLSVIQKQEKAYDETIQAVSELKNSLKNARQHPFVAEKTLNEAESIFERLCDELGANKSVHSKRILDDQVKEQIARIFSGKVGAPFAEEALTDLYLRGEERYKERVPPGYKDESKSPNSDLNSDKLRKYGDLVVWEQLSEKSRSEEKDIIFITDDKKEDWWLIFNGKTLGPRPELVAEFKASTKCKFHMYKADRFLEMTGTYLHEEIDDEVVNEIRELRERRAQAKEEEFFRWRSGNKFRKKYLILERQYQVAKKRVNFLETKIEGVNSELNAAHRRKFVETDQYVTDDLNEKVDALSQEVMRLESALADERQNLAEYAAAMHRLDARLAGTGQRNYLKQRSDYTFDEIFSEREGIHNGIHEFDRDHE